MNIHLIRSISIKILYKNNIYIYILNHIFIIIKNIDFVIFICIYLNIYIYMICFQNVFSQNGGFIAIPWGPLLSLF